MEQNIDKDKGKEKANKQSRKILKGIVKSDKMNKTRVVVVERKLLHRKFKKYYTKRTICYTHDEKNLSKKGDYVEIMETRPLSKLKRWKLIKVLNPTKQQSKTNESTTNNQ